MIKDITIALVITFILALLLFTWSNWGSLFDSYEPPPPPTSKTEAKADITLTRTIR